MNVISNYNKVTNPLDKKSHKNSNPSFSGCILTQDEIGDDIYKFFVPNAPWGTKVEVVVMEKNHDNEYKVHQKPKFYDLNMGNDPLILTRDDIKVDKGSVLGYKIHIPGKMDLEHCVTGDQGYHIATSPTNSNLALPKVINHIFVDSFNVKNKKNLETKRNHFNILGGNINSVREKIPELSEAGYTDLLGNPVSGQDNKSSQGYWTTNPYQITRNLGTLTDFKNLILDMYQKQMRWTFDGAFVNEGAEGIHVIDIMNHGQDSPFINNFETKNLENMTAKLGLLSKNEHVNKHTHIQLMNAPYKITFVKDGDRYVEKEVKRTSYDSTKPTYIQIFDDRLASEKQMNGNEIFDIYDKKTTGDDFDIAGYMDSVQSYHALVTPKEVETNYKKYKEAKHYDKDLEFKSRLTRWTNFEVVPSNKDGGLGLWVGNSDIAKKRFIQPEQTVIDRITNEETKKLIEAAPFQTQDDTVQVGKFWTSEVARTLTEYTARELAQKVKEGKTYEQAVKELAGNGKLPKDAVKITEVDDDSDASPLENILTVSYKNAGQRLYNLKPVKMPSSITDGMMSFPFDAIEFSPDLVSIFSYPYIKNMAVTKDTVGKSRYEMYQMGDQYYNLMPERYRRLYQKMDSVIASDMKNQAKSILGQVGRKMNIEVFDAKENLTQEGKELFSIISPDIAKFLIVSALDSKIMPKENDKMLEYDPEELRKISMNSLNLQYEVSPEDKAERLIDKIQKGVDGIDENKKAIIVEHLLKRLKNINSDAINVAKLIIEKTESGLNWRIDAAKDVGTPEMVEDDRVAFDKNKKEILDFWKKFNTGVTLYNPKRHSTGELTDWGQGVLHEFKERAEFTTVSDYDYFFSLLPSLFGQNDEGVHQSNFSSVIQEKLFSKGNSLGYFDSGTEESLNYAHRFIGNHDKPRILHLFALDMGKFWSNKSAAMSDALNRGFYGSDKFKSLDSKYQGEITNAIKLLESGEYSKDGKTKHFKAENFGVRPFDFNIDEVINQAKERSSDFRSFADNNPDTIKKLKAQTLNAILAPAMEKYRALWFMMNALPGAPTNFAGDEMGMSGWETKCKNEKQENRNALRWDRLEDPDYAFLKDYKRKVDDVTRIRRKEAASALCNGSTLKLEDQQIPGQSNAVTLYRYNDKTDAICVLHNNGFGEDVNAAGHDVYVDAIRLGGLPNGLINGTRYIDALNPDNKFVVSDGYMLKKENGENINLGNAGLILLRETDYKGKPLSFKGRMENANVKLANTKYNFAAPVYSKI